MADPTYPPSPWSLHGQLWLSLFRVRPGADPLHPDRQEAAAAEFLRERTARVVADETALVREHGPEGATAAQAAIAWVAQLDGVSTVIPGARSADQARANAAAGELPALSSAFGDGVRRIYDERVRAEVHGRW